MYNYLKSQQMQRGGKLRRLERFQKYVNRMWIPINPDVLERVRDGIKTGAYDLDYSFLFLEIKNDIGLFLRTLQVLFDIIQREDADVTPFMSPVEIFEWAGEQRLKQIFLESDLFDTSHTIESSDPMQLCRFKEALIAGSAAEVMSEKLSLGGETGFSVSLIRQMGLLLAVWNYPKTYKKVLEKVSNGINFNMAFEDIFGFSIELLTLSLIDSWNLDPVIKGAVGPEQESDDSDEYKSLLRKICEVGESLARANYPEYYKSAEKDWAFAAGQISNIIGEGALRVVQKKVSENMTEYKKQYEKFFSEKSLLDPEKRIQSIRPVEKKVASPEEVALPDGKLKDRLAAFYELLAEDLPQSMLLNKLVSEVVLKSGYSGGIVFVNNPLKGTLIPKLKFGELNFNENGAINLKSDDDSMVAIGYNCNIPVMETAVLVNDSKLRMISGVLGKKKIGALYLESPDFIGNNYSVEKSFFKAIRAAFEDILKLEHSR